MSSKSKKRSKKSPKTSAKKAAKEEPKVQRPDGGQVAGSYGRKALILIVVLLVVWVIQSALGLGW